MEPGKLPPPDPAPEAPPSLVDRLGAAARRKPDAPRRGLPAGVLLAGALWVGSSLAASAISYVATAKVAQLSSGTVEPDPVRLERRALASLGAGSFSAQVDRIARLLPAEARLQSLEVDRRDDAARLLAEIATPDPDRLRSALARAGGGRPLRVVNERRGDGVIIVSIEGEP